MAPVQRIEVTKIEDGQARAVWDDVIKELAFEINVNGRLLTQLDCSPLDLKALVYGHLFSEGIIQAKEDLLELSLSQKKAQAVVKADRGRPQKNLARGVTLTLAELSRAVQVLEARSPLSSSTGGVHSCSLYHADLPAIIKEDIGRHNTIDKVLGEAFLSGWDFSQTYLVSSGRVFASTVAKALQAGVPIVISVAAPTQRAVGLAQEGNLTLCGFASPRRLNIYSAAQRIIL